MLFLFAHNIISLYFLHSLFFVSMFADIKKLAEKLKK
nr:MAG TPA: hypothetical protein [Caudoviricetes sp.]